MKTGIEIIAGERQKQIDKHGFTGEHHANHPEWYDKEQLLVAAEHLMFDISDKSRADHLSYLPINWNAEWWLDLCSRSFDERLGVSGALIAAEIDRRTAKRK